MSKNFFSELFDLRDRAYEKKDKRLGRVYRDIIQYILSGNYSSSKHAVDIPKLMRDGYTSKQISEMSGLSWSTVRNTIKALSDSLYSIFGSDLFSLLKSEREPVIEGCEKFVNSIVSSNVDSKSMVVSEILLGVRYEANRKELSKVFDLHECSEEISLLQEFSKVKLLDRLNILDKDKLLYLIGLLDNSIGVTEDRVQLLNMLR